MKLFEFGPVVQQEILFNDISYLELWRPCYSAEWNHLCDFGKEHYEEQFCENVLNFDQWFRRCHLKDFLSGALAALLFSGLCNLNRGYHGGTFMCSYMKFGPLV